MSRLEALRLLLKKAAREEAEKESQYARGVPDEPRTSPTRREIGA